MSNADQDPAIRAAQAPNRVPLWAKVGLVVGGGIAVASAVYMDKHEVETSDQAFITVMEPFSDNTILTHIDEPEVGVAIVGLAGGAVAVQSLAEIIACRRERG